MLMPEVGSRLRQARKAAGYTQSQLGEMAGMTQAAISKIERGDGNPSLPSAVKLADILSIPLTDLLGIYRKTDTDDITKER